MNYASNVFRHTHTASTTVHDFSKKEKLEHVNVDIIEIIISFRANVIFRFVAFKMYMLGSSWNFPSPTDTAGHVTTIQPKEINF